MTENRNPIKPAMARLVANFSGIVGRARGQGNDVQDRVLEFAEERALETKLVDVSFTFIGARVRLEFLSFYERT